MKTISWEDNLYQEKAFNGFSDSAFNARRPNVKSWTKDEDDFLQNNSLIMTAKEIKKHIKGVTESQIRYRCRSLGLFLKNFPARENISQGTVKKWTTEEDEFIKNNAHTMSIVEIMNHIPATYGQIQHRCRKYLKVKPKRASRRRWTVEELEELATGADEEITKKLGREKLHLKLDKLRSKPKNELFISERERELFEESLCFQCVNESANKCCSILTNAFNDKFPKQWEVVGDRPSCKKFQPKKS